MFLSPQTTKFIDERGHYLIRNAKRADELTDYDLKKIAESAGVTGIRSLFLWTQGKGR